jgi:HEXXH motif-containing protein
VTELPRLQSSQKAFEEICAGPVSEETVAFLRKGHFSLRRLHLCTLVQLAPQLRDRLGPFQDLEHAWTVLAAIERRDAALVEDVLMAPSVGVWLARALQQAVSEAPDLTTLRVDIGWLHALAGAAAARCGHPCVLPVPIVHQAVYLPTVGRIPLPADFGAEFADLHVDPDSATLRVGDHAISLSELEPSLRHRSVADTAVLTVMMDAVDPYRGFSPSPANIEPIDYPQWTSLIDDAWRLLADNHARHLTELSSGLAAIVPLSTDLGLFAASSSAAFGSVGVSPKESATDLADALIHEFQHSKLNALLDLVDLVRPGPQPLLYAPWRDDPRPLIGVLHGIYAFVSVVEFWDTELRSSPSGTRSAMLAFALRARQLAKVIDSVDARPELTDLGHQLVDTASVRLADRPVVGLPPDITAAVDLLIADHYLSWRIHHVRPERNRVSQLVADWIAGRPATVVNAKDDVVHGASTGTSRRAELVRQLALEPWSRQHLTVDGADAAFAFGDYELAAKTYLDQVHDDPADVGAWAGLALTCEASVLHECPELVRAVYLEACSAVPALPHPHDIITWFDEERVVAG